MSCSCLVYSLSSLLPSSIDLFPLVSFCIAQSLLSCLFLSYLVSFYLALPCVFLSCIVYVYLVLPCVAYSYLVLFLSILPCLVFSYLALFLSIVFCLVYSYIVLSLPIFSIFSYLVLSCLFIGCLALSYPTLLCVFLPCPVPSYLFFSCFVWYIPVLSLPILTCLVSSCLVLPWIFLALYLLLLFCLIYSCLVCHGLTLSCLALSHPILSCLFLSYLFSSYLVLPCLFSLVSSVLVLPGLLVRPCDVYYCPVLSVVFNCLNLESFTQQWLFLFPIVFSKRHTINSVHVFILPTHAVLCLLGARKSGAGSLLLERLVRSTKFQFDKSHGAVRAQCTQAKLTRWSPSIWYSNPLAQFKMHRSTRMAPAEVVGGWRHTLRPTYYLLLARIAF